MAQHRPAAGGNNGPVSMLEETRRKLGPDKLVVFNGLRGGDGKQFLPLASGAMIEHFGHFSGVGKEKMAEDLDAMRAAARASKIVCLKAWPETHRPVPVADKILFNRIHFALR